MVDCKYVHEFSKVFIPYEKEVGLLMLQKGEQYVYKPADIPWEFANQH